MLTNFSTAKTGSSYTEPGKSQALKQLQSSIPPTRANHLLQFKENPDAWLMVDKILQDAQYPQTKCMPSPPLFHHPPFFANLYFNSPRPPSS